LAFQLHQAPDPGAVGAEVGLDVGGRLMEGGQVDAEQLGALFQRRRDRTAQGRGLYRQAKPLAEQALTVTQQALGAGYREVSWRCHTLGKVLRELGDLAGAKSQFD
jgi:hypothetical protein